MPQLESVLIQRNERNRDSFDIASLGDLQKHTSIIVARVTQEEIDTLAQLSNRGQLEALTLMGQSLDDVGVLEGFDSLSNLNIIGSSEELIDVDLSPFPGLEGVMFKICNHLKSVRGLTTHPTLKHAHILKTVPIW